MKGYRKPSGVYIELGDEIPVSPTLAQVALRPSPNHTFATDWATAPLDPFVCWRLKTANEANAERDSELTAFLDSVGGKAVKAIAQVGIEKGYWTLGELRTKYRSL